MATRTSTKRKPASKKTAPRTAKATKARSSSSSTQSHTPTPGLYGWITHTELASADPNATKAWCAEVLGWTFRPSFPTPDGDYHLFAYSEKGGGGIRKNNRKEVPGSIPYVHVADVDASFAKAIKEGAQEMFAPETMMPGVRIAIVRAPGGVPIGFSGQSEPTNGSSR